MASGTNTITLGTISTADGAYVCTVTFTDTAGNAAGALSLTSFTLDTTAPTISTVVFASGDYVNNAEDESAIDLVITMSDTSANGRVATATLNSADYVCTISSTACTASITSAGLKDLTDGTSYSFSVAISDAAGNAATAHTAESFLYDITAPSISNVVASWGDYLNAAEDNADGTVTVTTLNAADSSTVTVTGMGVTDTCSTSSNSCAATVEAAHLQALSDGTTYTITVALTADAAGNTATSDTGDTFVYDNPFTDEKPPFHEGDEVGYFGSRRHRLHRNHPVGAGPRQNSPLSGLRL